MERDVRTGRVAWAAMVAVHPCDELVGGGHESDVFGHEHAWSKRGPVDVGREGGAKGVDGGSSMLEAGSRVAQRWQQ